MAASGDPGYTNESYALTQLSDTLAGKGIYVTIWKKPAR